MERKGKEGTVYALPNSAPAGSEAVISLGGLVSGEDLGG